MKTYLRSHKAFSFFALFLFVFTAASFAQLPTFAWVKTANNTASSYGVIGFAIAVDAAGNTYTTGGFAQTVDFDPGPSVFNLTSNNNSGDIFVVKLDSNGNFKWAKSIGGIFAEIGRAIAIDGMGNVCITGSFVGTVDFDPGLGIFNLTDHGVASYTSEDIFILKIDTAGNFKWAKSIGSSTPNSYNYEEPTSIAIDNAGNVFTSGGFMGTAYFDTGLGTDSITSVGGQDIFVAKLDAAGNFVWVKSIGSTTNDISNSVTTDVAGNVYTSGFFADTADFDPGPGVSILTPPGSGTNNGFTCKMDATGNLVWAKNGGSGKIAVDNAANVFLAGSFLGTVDFDPGAGVYNLTSAAGSSDIFVCKLNASGNFSWAKQMGSMGGGTTQ